MNTHFPDSPELDRRRFLAQLGAVAGIGALATPSLLAHLNPNAGRNAAGIPMRVLGRTKEKITIVALGTAPVGHSMPGAAAGVPVFRAALEAGVNYVDTARNYDDAEAYLGELMPQWRDKIFLTTKALPRSSDPAEAVRQMEKEFETSLRKLKTDHVDLLYVHSVGEKTPDMIMAPDGPLDFARKMKAAGKTRFIGITGHNRPGARFTKIIESGAIDVLMVVLNFADYHTYEFEKEVLPAARKHECGIVAMKVFGGHRGNFAGYRQRGPSKMPVEHLEQAMRYSLSIEGVATAAIGPYTVEEAKQNVEWAKRFKPLSADERAKLRDIGKPLAADWGARFGPAA